MSENERPQEDAQRQQRPGRELSPNETLDVSPEEQGAYLAQQLLDKFDGEPDERLRRAVQEVQGRIGNVEQDLRRLKRQRIAYRNAEERLKQVGRERDRVESDASELADDLNETEDDAEEEHEEVA